MVKVQVQNSGQLGVLVLGASFAGLELIHQLGRRGFWRRRPNARVCIVDRARCSAYIPLIHEDLLAPDLPPAPVQHQRWLSGHPRVAFIQGEITEVDLVRRHVQLADGRSLGADQLVIALGSEIRAPRSVDPHGQMWVVKTQAQRERIHERLRQEPVVRRVAVIGGGLSGVELAGELVHRSQGALEVHLVHAQARLLPGLAPRAARLSARRLAALGVRLHLGCRAQQLNDDGLTLTGAGSTPKRLDADLVCWAGGVQPVSDIVWEDAARDPEGWLCVDEALRVFASSSAQPHANCFAIGDLASIVRSPGAPRAPTARRAIEAIFQAQTLAQTLCAPTRPKLHPVRPHWPHGVSVGPTSIVTYRGWAVDLHAVGRWFRRWLAARYVQRYSSLASLSSSPPLPPLPPSGSGTGQGSSQSSEPLR